MSDNVPLKTQKSCIEVCTEDEYVEIRVEVYTYVYTDTKKTEKKLYVYVGIGQYEEAFQVCFISSNCVLLTYFV